MFAQTGLFEKVRKKLFEKDAIEWASEPKRDAYRKTDKEYKARLVKESEAFEAKQKGGSY